MALFITPLSPNANIAWEEVLLAQLHYDRADIAAISAAAALMMDVVIAMVADAVGGGSEPVRQGSPEV